MPAFNPNTGIPDLSSKIIIVTGGNVGIGFETVKALLKKNAKVYLAARSKDKAIAAIATLKAETGKDAIFLRLDLSDLASVKMAVEEFTSKEGHLDVLFNNAGVMISPVADLTAQGYDIQFGTNVLGHYALTKGLLSSLARTKSLSGEPARVVYLSSEGHNLAPGETGIEYETLKGGPSRDKWIASRGSTRAPWALYGQSKLGDILLAQVLARDFPASGVAACSVHPGLIPGTALGRTMPKWQKWMFKPLSLLPSVGGSNEMGAWTSLFAGVSISPEAMNGQYCIPWGKVGKCNPKGRNVETQNRLIAWLDAELDLFYGSHP